MTSIAIIGSGVAGLGCAWFLRHDYDVTVFEADTHLGGHANTLRLDEAGVPIPIDTGFMVFNQVTYPNLLELFQRLDVPMRRTEMSFAVRHGPRDLEFCGSSMNHLFAQRRNLFRPAFYRMLRQIDRFNREAVPALTDPTVETQTLGEYVQARGYGEDFLNLYLVPMSSAVWSTPPDKMLQFPAATLLRFFFNHGFLGLHTQHPWWTVDGGSQVYIEKLTAGWRDRIFLRTPVRSVRRDATGVKIETEGEGAHFDRVVFACHPPTALSLLGSAATDLERRVLVPFRYQPNTATLHTDDRVMPKRALARASWNFRLELPEQATADTPLEASTHYWMNRLQHISSRLNYYVSINGEALIDPAKVLRKIAYEHPLFDLSARAARAEIAALNADGDDQTRTYFAGAWQGYGFHEDGLVSAVTLAGQLLGRDPWAQRRALEVA